MIFNFRFIVPDYNYCQIGEGLRRILRQSVSNRQKGEPLLERMT